MRSVLIRHAARWRWILAAVAILAGTFSGVLDRVDLDIIDLRSGLVSREASGEVVVVGIDAQSIEALRQWPWPRRYHATVIDRLLAADARRIAIDVDFSSASNEVDDAALRRALARAGPARVSLPFFRQMQPDADGSLRVVETGPHPQFAPLVALSNVNVLPDVDGLVRHYPPGEALEGAQHPALAVWAIGGDGVATVERLPPGPIAVDFSIDVETVPYVGFVDVLEGRFDPAWFQGRVVLIGAIDLSLGDFVATPRYRALPGVMFHALAAETLLLDRPLRVLDARPFGVVLALLALVLGRRLELLRWRRAALLTTGAAVLAVALASAGQILAAWTFELDAVLVGWVAVNAALAQRHVALLRLRRRVAARRAERRHRLVEGIVANSFDGILTCSAAGRVLSANPAAAAIFDAAPAQLVGRELGALLPTIAGRLIESCSLSRDFRGTVALARPGSGQQTLEVVLSTFLDARIGSVVGILVLRDVSELRATAAALDHVRHHDQLTGLPNRVLFERGLEASIAAARIAGVKVDCVVVALEGLAEIDSATLADEMVVQLGDRLGRLAGDGAALARTGPFEFAIEVPQRAGDDGAFLSRLVEAAGEPCRVGGQSLGVELRLGVASYPAHAADARNLVRCATVAARHAEAGPVHVAPYDPSLDRRLQRRRSVLSALRSAIGEQAFTVVYQPKVHAGSLALAGLESLVRWNDPAFGPVSPAEFVPIAEEAGLIDELTRLVAAQVMRDQAVLAAGGLAVPVAINLSGRSLGAADGGRSLVDHVIGLGARPATIAFEVTETAVMQDPTVAVALLGQLRDAGFEVMLDDFGTGYSSFGLLRDLPLSGLKLDRALVRAVPGDRSGDDVVASIVELARRLDLKTVAEGVESAADLRRLRGLGCDTLQGYLTGRPMLPAALVEWHGRGGARSAVASAAAPDRTAPAAGPVRPAAGQGQRQLAAVD